MVGPSKQWLVPIERVVRCDALVEAWNSKDAHLIASRGIEEAIDIYNEEDILWSVVGIPKEVDEA